MPMAIDRCVLPVPGLPINTIFFFSFIKLQVAQSLIIFLSMDGWKEKSKSSRALCEGNFAFA